MKLLGKWMGWVFGAIACVFLLAYGLGSGSYDSIVGEDLAGGDDVPNSQRTVIEALSERLASQPLTEHFEIRYHYNRDYYLKYDRITHILRYSVNPPIGKPKTLSYWTSPSIIREVARKKGTLEMFSKPF